jgi:hypothetical protein
MWASDRVDRRGDETGGKGIPDVKVIPAMEISPSSSKACDICVYTHKIHMYKYILYK